MDRRRRLRNAAVAMARRVYRATPSRTVREAYFKLFLSVVRGRRTVATVEGVTFDFDLGEMIDVGVYLQEYERDVVQLIERVCRPGWVVVDIGANIGAHALRCAKLVGPTGKVFAFEPADYAYRKLERNISLNSFENIQPVHVALSETNTEQGAMSVRSSWPTDGRHVVETAVVDHKRLDDWCSEHAIDHVNFIKLDVDGSEFSIIAGARDVLDRSRPVVLIEVGGWHFKDASRNPLRMLQELEYRFWDTRSLMEYEGLDAIGRLLPREDDEMTVSLNVMAALTRPDRVGGVGGEERRSS